MGTPPKEGKPLLLNTQTSLPAGRFAFENCDCDCKLLIFASWTNHHFAFITKTFARHYP